jgi:hypothetical protein
VYSLHTSSESIGYRPDLLWSGSVDGLTTLNVHSAVDEHITLFGIVTASSGQRSLRRFDIRLNDPPELTTRDLYISKPRSPWPKATSVLPLWSGQLIFGYGMCFPEDIF